MSLINDIESIVNRLEVDRLQLVHDVQTRSERIRQLLTKLSAMLESADDYEKEIMSGARRRGRPYGDSPRMRRALSESGLDEDALITLIQTGTSYNEISRKLGVDCRTVSKWHKTKRLIC